MRNEDPSPFRPPTPIPEFSSKTFGQSRSVTLLLGVGVPAALAVAGMSGELMIFYLDWRDSSTLRLASALVGVFAGFALVAMVYSRELLVRCVAFALVAAVYMFVIAGAVSVFRQ